MIARFPRRAFTLLELMVVITIIVILIAILVPTLERAMASAYKAQCLANLKAFSVGYKHYSLDNRGGSMNIPGGSRSYWNYALAPYMGFTGYGKGAQTGADKFMLCPETSVAYSGGFAPSAHGTWDWDTAQGSYGLNLFFMDYHSYNPGLGISGSLWYLKYDAAPGGAPLIGDSNWIGGWPDTNDADPGQYNGTPPDSGGWGVMIARWCLDRHGGYTMNMGFVDGSARNLILGELWALPWHQYCTNQGYRQGVWDKR